MYKRQAQGREPGTNNRGKARGVIALGEAAEGGGTQMRRGHSKRLLGLNEPGGGIAVEQPRRDQKPLDRSLLLDRLPHGADPLHKKDGFSLSVLAEPEPARPLDQGVRGAYDERRGPQRAQPGSAGPIGSKLLQEGPTAVRLVHLVQLAGSSRQTGEAA